MKELFERYLLELREAYSYAGTEHTGRTALENFLKAVAAQIAPNTHVQHEPKQQENKGAPDFKVTQSGMILGYIENKPIDTDLNRTLKTRQIQNYLELTDNLLITDYLHFVWIEGDNIQRESIAFSTDLDNKKFAPREDRLLAVGKILKGFFSMPPEGIGRAQRLALALATRSQFLRDYLGEELVRQQRRDTKGRLYGLYQIFRDQVFQELTLKEFADAFAQMLAYGLFLAKLNAGKKKVDLHNVKRFIPGSFSLIRELAEFLDLLENDPYRDIRWVVEEILSITNGLDLPAIHQDLSFRHRRVQRGVKAKSHEEARLFERDPFIYFYEDYLKAYDKGTRKSRGVYYTPPPIVNFIVRAVDDILKNKDTFNLKDGLADHRRVTVLDFACGTGTFLVELFQRIFDNIGGPNASTADLIVREHFLKNIFGFEYLIAPYTIAHLKLSQYLKDQNHPLESDERLQVFLTNTLEPVEPQENLLLPAISAEVEAAQRVKDQPILVITGNPPYQGISRNMGTAAQQLIEHYKYVDGQHFGERKHWLQDDYVKFLAFAQRKMDEVEEGIVAVITNHSWLDNVTFRGMRQSLMRSFDQIFVVDLHGSAKKKQAPDGSKDENVFDIEQGVAISIFVKRPTSDRIMRHANVWGSRFQKYSFLADSSLDNVNWTDLHPSGPNYLFRPSLTSDDAYRDFVSVLEIFQVRSTGIQTSRDRLAIGFTDREVQARLSKFADQNISDDFFRNTFFREHRTGRYTRGDTRGWKLSKVRKWVRENLPEVQCSVGPLAYRPFDIRYVMGHPKMIDWPRNEVMQHFGGENVALLLPRQLASEGYRHSFCTDLPSEMCVVSTKTKEQNYVFPLWLHPMEDARTENIFPDFRAYIDSRYERHYTPEEILGYIYAVLHAPSYRMRHAEFLRMDFPRVPFPESADFFETMSLLGWALLQAHLLRELPRRGLAVYHGRGDHTVDTVRYLLNEESISINKTQFFNPVPKSVWDFRIGGYQVLDKYLNDRKGRVLSLEEINHVAAVADSLSFTIDQMATIDEAYLAAFPDRG